MTDIEKAYQYFVIAVPESEEQAKAYFWARKALSTYLTPKNEPLTLEMVAEILSEQFGDECACNVNGNDEWLPMMCRYGDVCPYPPEHLGCWMELLRNKYRRPPEGEVDGE